ncbi:MAG TPA: hypothetical protein PLA91_01995 [Bacillota bacterium]|nr:hypothetical protein [Peptococcaceae bacterium MAG4]HPU35545.1 hypothetical protein [Bacillota bacterium]
MTKPAIALPNLASSTFARTFLILQSPLFFQGDRRGDRCQGPQSRAERAEQNFFRPTEPGPKTREKNFVERTLDSGRGGRVSLYASAAGRAPVQCGSGRRLPPDRQAEPMKPPAPHDWGAGGWGLGG